MCELNDIDFLRECFPKKALPSLFLKTASQQALRLLFPVYQMNGVFFYGRAVTLAAALVKRFSRLLYAYATGRSAKEQQSPHATEHILVFDAERDLFF